MIFMVQTCFSESISLITEHFSIVDNYIQAEMCQELDVDFCFARELHAY